jgi:hypothetical protein
MLHAFYRVFLAAFWPQKTDGSTLFVPVVISIPLHDCPHFVVRAKIVPNRLRLGVINIHCGHTGLYFTVPINSPNYRHRHELEMIPAFDKANAGK